MTSIENFSTWIKAKLNENKSTPYEYGCMMLYYDLLELEKIHSILDERDIFSPNDDRYGLEKEPHTTLLYGFHDSVSPTQIFNTCKKYDFEDLKLHNLSYFDNPEYDVLKFDIDYLNDDNNFLHSCNRELSKYPHTTSFPNYHPHCTVAYIKKGKGQHYADLFKDKSYIVTPNRLVYSMASGEKLEQLLK